MLADEVTVYDDGGTNTTPNIPVYGTSVKSFLTQSEFVIDKSLLTSLAGKEINKLTFYLSSSASSAWTKAVFKVYLEEVASNTYTSGAVAFKRTTSTPVYTGSLDATGSTMEITFNVAFPYSGSNHLLVAVEQTVKSTVNASASFYSGSYNYANRSAYISSATGGMGTTKGPKVTLTYEEPSVGSISTPTSLATSNIEPTSVDLSWSAGSDETAWQVSCSTVSEERSITEPFVVDNPYTIDGLTPNTTYYLSVRAKKGTSYSNWSSETSFTSAAEIAVTGVTISPTSWEMLAGETKTLTATVAPDNATFKTVTWESSNTDVATVSSSGVVDAQNPGTATITAKSTSDPTKQATCEITVTAPVTPTDLRASEVTTNYAYLTWTNGSTESKWQIKYGRGEIRTESEEISSKPFLITFLSPNTTYYASIRSKLGTAWSEYSEEISFTTPTLGPAPGGKTEITEDFESGWTTKSESDKTLNAVKAGWSYSRGCSAYILSTDYKYSGNGLYAGYNTGQYLIMPSVKIGSKVSFRACRATTSQYIASYVSLYKAIKIGNQFYISDDPLGTVNMPKGTSITMSDIQEITIPEGGYVAITFAYAAIDDLSYEASSTVTAITDNYGNATFASGSLLDLTTANLPSGLEAYKANVDGSTVKFTKLNQCVPANTGIFLQGDAYTEYKIAVASTSTEVTDNDFLVNTSGKTFGADPVYTYFGMKKNTDPLIFGVFDPGTVAVPASKAYLKVETSSLATARELKCVFDDGETTGIRLINENVVNGTDKLYDLQGRRVAKPTKGLYIQDGKKFIAK